VPRGLWALRWLKKERGQRTITSLIDLWLTKQDFFTGKAVHQIIPICGDGRLKDGNKTSAEFRDFLCNIPSPLLSQYATECLEASFDDSGMVLQDLVNEIGSRTGFVVKHGLYTGRKNKIGFDGIWSASDGHAIMIEVKTTDAYRMNLDKYAEYRRKLIENGEIQKDASSILIVVGREDTGGLEAQIRGSKHAWDMRLISTDALIKLMLLKENLNDTKTIQQINQVLRPQEYTRLDGLIELIFLTTKDVATEEIEEAEMEEQEPQVPGEAVSHEPKFHPVNFHDECVERIQKHLQTPIVKKSRSSYTTADKSTAIICSISKRHGTEEAPKYWFAFHPYYDDFLSAFPKSYVAYGCGDASQLALIPYEVFKPLVPFFWKTEREDRIYHHVVILEREGKLQLQVPKKGETVDITDRLL